MKRIGYLYEKIYDKQNIRHAIYRAAKGKRQRADVQRVLADIDKYTDRIHEMLISETFVPADYTEGTVTEGSKQKERKIFKPHFYPDQIIHWAMMLQLAPLFKRGMYAYTCGSVPGRGVHYGKHYIEKRVVRDRKNTKYYLKMDISKFYPSVDIPTLESKLARKIKDRQLLRLISIILEKGSGLPIGILLSQWFANFYLQGLDHFIKQELQARYYIRYMDDMVIFGSSKRELHKMRKAIALHLSSIKLKLKANFQVCRLDKEPTDFMGFRFHRGYTTIRKSIVFRITRKLRRIWKKGKATFQDAAAIISYLGWIKHSDSYRLFLLWIKPYLNINILKRAIRRKESVSYGKKKVRKHGVPAVA